MKIGEDLRKKLSSLRRRAAAGIEQTLEHRLCLPAVFRQKIDPNALGHKIDPNVRDLLGLQIRSISSVTIGK